MAKQLLKYTDWTSPSGFTYCNDVSDLTSVRSLWYTPARMLGITPAEYVKLLVERFRPDILKFGNNELIYGWKDYSKAHTFVLWINREARNRNFIV